MSENDPLDLEKVDQEIRINELKEKAAELAGGSLTFHESEDCPPEITEQFLRNVIDYESGTMTTDRSQLERDGVLLPPPDEMTDAQLAAKLDEIFNCLATHRTFIISTDHLSDRQLYEHLLQDTLEEEHVEMPPDCDGAYIIDLVSSGAEEETEAYLRYYADERTRQDWVKEFPDYVLPPKEKLPYDRDSRLPRAEGW